MSTAGAPERIVVDERVVSITATKGSLDAQEWEQVAAAVTAELDAATDAARRVLADRFPAAALEVTFER